MSANAPQRPIHSIQIRGGIEAAIWENQVERDGRTITRQSVTINKRFYDRTTAQYRESSTFFPEDLPRLTLALQQAYEFLMLNDSQAAPDRTDHGG